MEDSEHLKGITICLDSEDLVILGIEIDPEIPITVRSVSGNHPAGVLRRHPKESLIITIPGKYPYSVSTGDKQFVVTLEDLSKLPRKDKKSE